MGISNFLKKLCLISPGSPIALVEGTALAYELSDELIDFLKKDKAQLPSSLTDEFEVLRLFKYTPDGIETYKSGLVHITLNLTYGCNLSCNYCCVGPSGNYNENFLKMPRHIAKSSVDFLLDNSDSKVLLVGFFGGEPLLNWDILRYTIEYTRTFPKTWYYNLVTNGTLITEEVAQYLAKHRVRTVVSIDGPPEINDTQRPTRNGKGSYSETRNGIENLKKVGASFRLRATFAGPDKDQLESINKHLYDITSDPEMVAIGMEHSLYDNPDFARIKYNDEIQWAQKYKQDLLNGMVSFGSLASDLYLLIRGAVFQNNTCTAGIDNLFINPDGSVYVCHIAAANKRYYLGDIVSGINFELWQEIRENFRSIPQFCKTCWARTLCPKDCNLHRINMTEPDYDMCNHQKDLIKIALETLPHLNLNQIRFLFRESSKEELELLQEAYNLMEYIRQKNEHVRPLFLFPAVDSPIKQTLTATLI